MNPWYSNRFQTRYQTWLETHVGSCYVRCSSTWITTPTPLHVSTCGECLYHVSTTSQQALGSQGGGCSLCVEMVAPWAYHYHIRDRLPTTTELRTFLAGSVPAAYKTFHSLPPCDKATWLQQVCGTGGTTGEVYHLPLDHRVSDTNATHDAQVFKFVMLAIYILCGIVACYILYRVTRYLWPYQGPVQTPRHATEKASAAIKASVATQMNTSRHTTEEASAAIKASVAKHAARRKQYVDAPEVGAEEARSTATAHADDADQGRGLDHTSNVRVSVMPSRGYMTPSHSDPVRFRGRVGSAGRGTTNPTTGGATNTETPSRILRQQGMGFVEDGDSSEEETSYGVSWLTAENPIWEAGSSV
jgi:hypothetical protein